MATPGDGTEASAGAAEATLAAMYQDALLAHYRAPHNRREIAAPTASAEERNPMCGDALRAMVLLDGERIVDAAFTGRACSIATASASIMTDAVIGRTVREALQLIDSLRAMLGGSTELSLPDSLVPLRGVAPFAGRHGCAMMPWGALRRAIEEGPELPLSRKSGESRS